MAWERQVIKPINQSINIGIYCNGCNAMAAMAATVKNSNIWVGNIWLVFKNELYSLPKK